MINFSTNLSSLLAQSSLKTSSLKLNEAIERMSTGCKLNHSKDNAANYSISTSLTTKINSYQIAEDNTMMGLNLLATASDSLSLISDKLSRLRALAEQASNGTYGQTSLNAINSEANSLVDEIERIYTNTTYNGINLLQGSQQTSETSSFIRDITRHDTSSLTSLSNIDSTKPLTNGTYSISTAEELAQLSEMTNSGLIGSNTEFVLTSDIDLGTYSNWTPIGTEDNHFIGRFNGNGYEITNLTTTDSTRDYVGLFGYIENSSVENVSLSNVNVTGYNRLGALIGEAENSTISNCFTNGDIVCTFSNIGGVIGYATSCTITDCYSLATITGGNGDWLLGGVCGNIEDSFISGCYYSGTIDANVHQVGGVAGGLFNSTMRNCYAEGSLTARAYSGGLVGSINRGGEISNCYTKCKLNFSSPNYAQGGIAGEIWKGELLIENVYILTEMDSTYGIFTGLLRNDGSADLKFGLTIKDCYYLQDYVDAGLKEYSQCWVPYDSYVFENNQVYTSTDVPFTITNSAAITQYSGNTTLQVGITSDTSSRIDVNTSYYLGDIETLRQIGLDDSGYLSSIDRLLSNLSTKQTELGSAQNILESALDSISIQYENLVSSHSTIQDADIAEVSSEYIRQQILQQASATLMATANQAPAIALQLL